MAYLWLHEVEQYTCMGEAELSYCVVHLGFPLPRVTPDGIRWAIWEVDRWLAQDRGWPAA